MLPIVEKKETKLEYIQRCVLALTYQYQEDEAFYMCSEEYDKQIEESKPKPKKKDANSKAE